LRRCIEGVEPFCDEVVVTVCDHFFDGSAENYALLQEAFRQFPSCRFLLFAFDPQTSYRPFSPLFPEHPDWRREWHNTGRWLAALYADAKSDALLFLDADEIVDPGRFGDWLLREEWGNRSACRFAGLWHFREARFQAKIQSDLCLLVKRDQLSSALLFDEDERAGILKRIPGATARGVMGKDETPMVRHYSGVRTEEEMAKKFSTWGHHWERDWQQLLKSEYAAPFSGKDFIRGYTYQVIQPEFDPLQEKIPSLPVVSHGDFLKGLHRFPHVTMVSKDEAFKRSVKHEFGLSHRHSDQLLHQ
jgi:hypothetical protein